MAGRARGGRKKKGEAAPPDAEQAAAPESDAQAKGEGEKGEEEEEVFLTAVTPNDVTDESCKTFIFKDEGHTLGNALRYVISHYPEVLFCGHTIPHPSENEMHLRIQTAQGTSAVDVLRKGLQDLEGICDHVDSTFEKAVKKWEEENPGGAKEAKPFNLADFLDNN